MSKISEYSDGTTAVSTDKFIVSRGSGNNYLTALELGLIDGWIPANETWTYSSADSPSFVFTVSGDVTTKYSLGMKIRISQSTGGTKYFFITKISFGGGTTTITIYGGTDYTLNNETISSPYYSMWKSPFQFPLDPAKWTVETTSTSDPAKTSPVQNTWYGDTGLSPTGSNIVIPIGVWDVYYKCNAHVARASAGSMFIATSLSTSASSETDTEMTVSAGSGATTDHIGSMFASQQITLTTKTTYYLVTRSTLASQTSILIQGSQGPTVIRAVCAYL